MAVEHHERSANEHNGRALGYARHARQVAHAQYAGPALLRETNNAGVSLLVFIFAQY